MSAVKNAPKKPSVDPEMRRFPTDDEVAVFMHRHLLEASREEGWKLGRAIGAIEALCSDFGIELDYERQRLLKLLDFDALLYVFRKLATERRWPLE